MWTGRIALEVASHAAPSSFVTLTYEDEHVPPSGSLSREHWRAFSKSIGCRYFGVGEYGELHDRPHYHAILAGVPPGDAQHLVAQRWRWGFSAVSAYAAAHGAYVAGYVVKKWTRPRDELGERLPEFARMSRRPGIGIPGLAWLAEWLQTPQGALYVQRTGDVPAQVSIDRDTYPLGDTCRAWLRRAVALPEKDPTRLARYEARMSILSEEFPDLVKLREASRVIKYDRARRRSTRKGSL